MERQFDDEQLELLLGLEAGDKESALRSRDKVVQFLQYGVREGREAREAGDLIKGLSSNLQ